MDDVRRELDRLRRGWGGTRARDLAGRVHLVVLGAAFVAAFASRVLGPWPVIGALEGRWIATLLAVAGLWAVGPLLALLLPRLVRIPRLELARRLDDTLAWRDAADTSLGLAGGGTTSVESFLAVQTAGRLRDLDARRLWPRSVSGRWPRRILLFLFAFVLLAPGVLGLFDEAGAGRGERAGLGTSPEERPREPEDADVWQRAHMRLFLSADAPREKPLALEVLWGTDAPLPAPYEGDLFLLFDGEEVPLGPMSAEAGEKVEQPRDLDLGRIEALEELLTPGRHVAQTVLRPRRGPWREPLESRRLEIVLEEGGDGSGAGDSDQAEPQPQAETPPQPQPAPEPEPEPQPPPEPPPPVPEGPEERPAPPPPGEGPDEVVDPLVRHHDETVRKEEAVVAVPDPEAGLEPPPQVPLSEALAEFERVVERALGDERARGADRDFLLRYFRLLREGAKPPAEDGR